MGPNPRKERAESHIQEQVAKVSSEVLSDKNVETTEIAHQNEEHQSIEMIGDVASAIQVPEEKKPVKKVSKQFWQAGDIFIQEGIKMDVGEGGIDRARLHPRFLHSNATSHKWALGAFVELLDNSVDEVASGCTYAKIDKIDYMKEGNVHPMLLVEDNGGGMDTATIRNCMSFGFSSKQQKNLIGQYGNGFKTSTMRLGADALVLTKSKASGTCSIGMLSYTFLSETDAQDIMVPIIDYEKTGDEYKRLDKGMVKEWEGKLKIIQDWSPFKSEIEIWDQLNAMPEQGTRVYIWNLWHTSDDKLELDFSSNKNDIKLYEIEDADEESLRKKKSDEGSERCYAYMHSLRAYVSILYLEWPKNFKIIIRDELVVPTPIAEGMKHVDIHTYRPRSLQKEDKPISTKSTKSTHKGDKTAVVVNIGFALEAPNTNVSGLCVYHRNRLIKPFWKVYTSASSIGRGVIGYLDVNFVAPAHDKQDFENTPPLRNLEKYLKRQVPVYWRKNAHHIGYQEPVQPVRKVKTQSPNVHDQTPAPETAVIAQAITTPLPSSPLKFTPSTVTSMPEVPIETHTRPLETIDIPSSSLQIKTSEIKDVDISKDDEPMEHPRQPLANDYMKYIHTKVEELQKDVQEFCNKNNITEALQKKFGKVFGRSVSRVIAQCNHLSGADVFDFNNEKLNVLMNYLNEITFEGDQDYQILLPDSIRELLNNYNKAQKRGPEIKIEDEEDNVFRSPKKQKIEDVVAESTAIVETSGVDEKKEEVMEK